MRQPESYHQPPCQHCTPICMWCCCHLQMWWENWRHMWLLSTCVHQPQTLNISQQYTILTQSFSHVVWGELHFVFSARCITNASPHYCHDVRSSVCLSGTGVHCDHMVNVHVSADLSLLLDSPMFCAPCVTAKHVHLLPASFQLHLEERWSMDVQTRRRIKR